MPSRFGVALILAFWLAVVGHVIHRDVLPRYLHDTPNVQIDLADEATRSVLARWGIFRGDKRLGTLYTGMEPVEADDTFRFSSEFQDVNESVFGATVRSNRLYLTTVLHRDGRLAGQTMKGDLSVECRGITFSATAKVTGKVVDGLLVGQCAVKSPIIDFDEPLPPTPVPDGPVLHPLQPMNRLTNVHPGQRWEMRAIDPLSDAMKVLLKKVFEKYGGTSIEMPSDDSKFIAEVQSEPVDVQRRNGPVPCWIIEYRNDRAKARTWVAVKDGKVQRQEASLYGETLRLERED